MIAENAVADTGSPPPEPQLIRTLGKDIGVVWEQVGRVGVKQTFSRSFADLREFYLTTHRRDRLAGMGRVKRTLYLGLWLLKALFLKLTPSSQGRPTTSAATWWITCRSTRGGWALCWGTWPARGCRPRC
jgi:hypothetical protein